MRRCSRQGPRNFEEQIFAAFVKPGDVVYDVGANLGLTSFFLSRLAGRRGLVLAFEPVAATYLQLLKNISAISVWKSTIWPFNFGFYSSSLITTISVPNGVHELASLAPTSRWITQHLASQYTTQECAFFSLDEFVFNEHIPKPSFVKFDVEGAERYVVEGAKKLLFSGNLPVLFLEVFAPWQRAFGYTPADFFQLFHGSSYLFFFLCPEGLIRHTPTPDCPFPAEFIRGYNVLAIPRNNDELLRIAMTFSPEKQPRLLKMQPPPERNL